MALDMSVLGRFAKSYKAGEIIFCEYEPGDAFYLIQSGKVRIVKIMDDIEKTIDILQPGEFFGEMALLEEAPRSASAITVEDAKLLEFNKENFEILMKGNPQIVLKLLKLFTKRIYDQKRRFMILTLPEDSVKVADVFLMLNETQPDTDEDEQEKTFHSSVEDIAHWAGMSPAKCHSVLNSFAAQRRVEIFQDRIVVKNINDFHRFVNSRRRSQKGV
ncbi:Crp/Fnr family transcriptional regulator [Spirochaeta cellobiosiphila]|uniref:Crp/Fnr family transcriptional regulator n=1 Tax=Spirochaeta cellobiosiphila TaxID=504483 RepID=UPI00041BB757|nr:Crp/Fnr family transcriptional regulator [Spirochaeta cellobiosiphila]